MKIEYVKGDLLESSERTILHGCNSRGVMGAGIALQIKQKYPKAYDDYRDRYESHGLNLGDVIVSFDMSGRVILHGITQISYTGPGVRLDYEGLDRVMATVDSMADISGRDRIAMPKIGAGLARGDWNNIVEIIERRAINFQPVVYVLE